MSATEAAVTALAAAVANVPGVTRLYPAGALVARVGSALGAAVTGDAAPGGEIVVGDERIVVRVGVAAAAPAASVCRDVYTVCRSWAENEGLAATIEVTAATIDEDASPAGALL